MRISVHQPDLLPYSGFWHKMLESDGMIIAVHDQFMKRGYQRRVRMRGSWCSVPLQANPHLVPISSVKVVDGWQMHLVNVIRGRYAGSRFWSPRGPSLCDDIESCRGEFLVDVNLQLIHLIRDRLGIATPLLQTVPPKQHGLDRLIEQVLAVGGTEYLSGPGGHAYMGECPARRFAEAGLGLTWSTHSPSTPDSVLTAFFDVEDPMAVVTRKRAC